MPASSITTALPGASTCAAGPAKRYGRFVILHDRVITSGRNFRAHSFWSCARLVMRLAVSGVDDFRDRRGLEIWYRPLREKLAKHGHLEQSDGPKE